MFNFSYAISTYYAEFIVLLLVIITVLPVFGLVLVLISWKFSMILDSSKLQKNVYGKHCLVTGGSLGLGRGIAEELVKAGANVTIVARGKKSVDGKSALEDTCKDLHKMQVSPDQIIEFVVRL